jgi:hypothetical protein
VTSPPVSVIVTPKPGPVIQTFQADPGSIERGGTATLRWTVSNATRLTLEPGLGSQRSQGETSVSPQQTTTYTLTAEGPGGSVYNTATVRVAAAAPPSIGFEVDPSSIIAGQSATLRWNVARATHVTIDPELGPVGVSGTRPVRPTRSTRYVLTAEGPGGTLTREVNISVGAAPPPAGQLIWTGEVHGLQMITIDKDRADVGELEGSLPGVLCLIQPVDDKHVSVASPPGPRNNYLRLVIRVNGNGRMRVVIKWSLP